MTIDTTHSPHHHQQFGCLDEDDDQPETKDQNNNNNNSHRRQSKKLGRLVGSFNALLSLSNHNSSHSVGRQSFQSPYESRHRRRTSHHHGDDDDSSLESKEESSDEYDDDISIASARSTASTVAQRAGNALKKLGNTFKPKQRNSVGSISSSGGSFDNDDDDDDNRSVCSSISTASSVKEFAADALRKLGTTLKITPVMADSSTYTNHGDPWDSDLEEDDDDDYDYGEFEECITTSKGSNHNKNNNGGPLMSIGKVLFPGNCGTRDDHDADDENDISSSSSEYEEDLEEDSSRSDADEKIRGRRSSNGKGLKLLTRSASSRRLPLRQKSWGSTASAASNSSGSSRGSIKAHLFRRNQTI